MCTKYTVCWPEIVGRFRGESDFAHVPIFNVNVLTRMVLAVAVFDFLTVRSAQTPLSVFAPHRGKKPDEAKSLTMLRHNLYSVEDERAFCER